MGFVQYFYHKFVVRSMSGADALTCRDFYNFFIVTDKSA